MNPAAWRALAMAAMVMSAMVAACGLGGTHVFVICPAGELSHGRTCVTSAPSDPATGVRLPSTWNSGQYSARRVGVAPNSHGDCRAGSFVGARIPLPPGSWELTITVPGGCNGADAHGGTLATVVARRYVQVGVSAEACVPTSATPPSTR
jgi:hypothetical protein